MSGRETSLRTKRSAPLRSSFCRARSRPPSPVSAAKPTRSWPSRRRSPSADSTSVVGSSSSVHVVRVLRPLGGERLGWAVVGHRGGHDHDVGLGARASASRSRSAAVGVSTSSTPAGAGAARFAASSVDLGATPVRLGRERDAHPPRRAIADERTASTGSLVPPAETSTVFPCNAALAVERFVRRAEDLLRLRHPPHAELAFRGLALIRPDEHDATRTQRLGIHAGRRCAHMRGFIAGATSTGPRCASAASVRTLSAMPVRELGQRVRRARRDDEQVGARQVEVDVVSGGPARERAERLGRDKALGARRDERNDLVALLDEQPAQLARLVGGDAAGHPQEDAGHARMMPNYLA